MRFDAFSLLNLCISSRDRDFSVPGDRAVRDLPRFAAGQIVYRLTQNGQKIRFDAGITSIRMVALFSAKFWCVEGFH